MASLDWSQCSAIESVPGRLSGAWVFRDTRMPVSAVFENLEAGATIEEIIEQFDITRNRLMWYLRLPPAALIRPRSPFPLQTHPWMLILFDHVTPRGIARFLPGHTVTKAKDRGWDTLTNGDLLAAAEGAGFDVLLTADKNMRYQQNLTGRRIALVVLSTPQWPRVRLHLDIIAAAVNAAAPGSYTEVDIPYE